MSAEASAVTRYFRDHASRYGLGPSFHVEQKLNWGGFVNLHFDVSDGATAYHVKLSRDEGVLSGLERWRSLAPELESRYRAPAIVEWIDLGEASLSGLVLEWSDGRPADLRAQPGIVHDVLALADRLHEDEEIERALRERDMDDDAFESVLAHYLDHLEADVAESGHRYPVDRAVLDWVRRELAALRRLFQRESAFAGVRAVPIHGDLWTDNILVDSLEHGRWHLVDWDDLALGDPVVDYATLLWPLERDGLDPSPWLGRRGREPGFTARLRLCFRAALLDEVVDSLADWVEAEQMPEHRDRVRAVKRAVHERAFAHYRKRYGERSE